MNEQLTETPTQKANVSQHIATPHNISTAGVALAAGVAGAAFLTAKSARAITPALKFSDIPGSGDTKVLNYALALEDLETELYIQALQRLTTGGTGGPNAASGMRITGLNTPSSEEDVDYLAIFGKVEKEHSTFLRTTLGGNAISPFKYDFGLATANRRRVVEIVYDAELTGVGAYLGAVPFFTGSNVDLMRIAASILGTEARHTAVVADILNDKFGTRTPVAPPFNIMNGRDKPVTPDEVLAHVSPFIVAPAN